jgi:hypothetical protein
VFENGDEKSFLTAKQLAACGCFDGAPSSEELGWAAPAAARYATRAYPTTNEGAGMAEQQTSERGVGCRFAKEIPRG